MLTYNDFGTWIRQRFPFRVQKIAVDAGFTCPNRDGRLSTGGCVYCDNRTFNPSYCNPLKSVTEQLEEGKRFFQRKYPDMKYLAYFRPLPIPMLLFPSCENSMRRRCAYPMWLDW